MQEKENGWPYLIASLVNFVYFTLLGLNLKLMQKSRLAIWYILDLTASVDIFLLSREIKLM